jgi:hypothetical protein
MADQPDYEQLATYGLDFRFYALGALGNSHPITDIPQMISRGFPSDVDLQLAAAIGIPKALLQKTPHAPQSP